MYYYNACRVPLRLGMHVLLNGNTASKNIVAKISSWAEQNHISPLNIKAGYSLDGSTLPDSDFISTVFIAPFGVAAMNFPKQQSWLNNVYETVYQNHQEYYEDTINLLSMMVMTGNFWAPQ